MGSYLKMLSKQTANSTSQVSTVRTKVLKCSHLRETVKITSCLLSCLILTPTMALVDDRLAGEGTGKALGINDPILGWVLVSVFTTIWALYYVSTKELGGQREEDGLGL